VQFYLHNAYGTPTNKISSYQSNYQVKYIPITYKNVIDLSMLVISYETLAYMKPKSTQL